QVAAPAPAEVPIERIAAELPVAGIAPPAPPVSADFALEPYDLELRLQKGDTLDGMLADIGVPAEDRAAIAQALAKFLRRHPLSAGEAVQLSLQAGPDAPDNPHVLSLLVRPEAEREYTLKRDPAGAYAGEEKIYEVRPRIVRVAAARRGSLLESGVAAGAPAAAIREFIKALSYGVDFQRELKSGQKFSLLLEQGVTEDGRVAEQGRLLAGQLELAKRTETVIAYRPKGGARQFYTPDGYSVVRAFLRTPMDASHVSSPFGYRQHPILGYSRLHEGVDFAAPKGTPILAAGNGRVAMAGVRGGYGIYVKLVHTAEIATAYGHMSRLGPGIRPGVKARQGQVIGFVGSTGMSTGPHLHYEFHRHGRPVNPLVQRASLRLRLAGKDLKSFQALVRQYLGRLRTAPLLHRAH
ncbi:MAG: peptidoglycan DD-metalloendopeptidase family protein, partial [Proteobacteria bacterium]|nr:peptidoglycan DD-metalloendopeptidase family protein [Pseudomonadota bacterium]